MDEIKKTVFYFFDVFDHEKTISYHRMKSFSYLCIYEVTFEFGLYP